MCLHCEEPLCKEACPVSAIDIQNGWVVIDSQKCIGCGACVSACPYRAIHRESYEGAKAVKCDGCMGAYSEKPRCAEACPTGALEYGYRSALIKKGMQRADSYGMQLFGRDQHGGQNVLRIGTRETYSKNSIRDNYDYRAQKLVHGIVASLPWASFFPRYVNKFARATVRFFQNRLGK